VELAREFTKDEVISIIDLALMANAVIMSYYGTQELGVALKMDESPVTKADQEASDLIARELIRLFPDIPVISEEMESRINLNTLQNHTLFWLVDPLDGTKSFIRGEDYFTVNIALIQDGEPIFGIITSPIDETIYYTFSGQAHKVEQDGRHHPIFSSHHKSCRSAIIAHRFESKRLMNMLQELDVQAVDPVGSSVKFCLLAEGKAEIFPKFGPTSTWDSAAGHAILRAAGGEVVHAKTLQPLRYDQGLENPHFIAVANQEVLNQVKALLERG
jgi:3'(2'), 5'-bisphosphate nucleotidase